MALTYYMIKIFVGGLSPEVSEMDLVVFVSIYAEVRTVKLVRDKATAKSKGYAFLEMASQLEAEKAVAELNDITFRGNTLTVKIAEEKPVQPARYLKVGKATNNIKPKRPRLR